MFDLLTWHEYTTARIDVLANVEGSDNVFIWFPISLRNFDSRSSYANTFLGALHGSATARL